MNMQYNQGLANALRSPGNVSRPSPFQLGGQFPEQMGQMGQMPPQQNMGLVQQLRQKGSTPNMIGRTAQGAMQGAAMGGLPGALAGGALGFLTSGGAKKLSDAFKVF